MSDNKNNNRNQPKSNPSSPSNHPKPVGIARENLSHQGDRSSLNKSMSAAPPPKPPKK